MVWRFGSASAIARKRSIASLAAPRLPRWACSSPASRHKSGWSGANSSIVSTTCTALAMRSVQIIISVGVALITVLGYDRLVERGDPVGQRIGGPGGAGGDVVAELRQMIAIAVERDLTAFERGERQRCGADIELRSRRGGDAAQRRLGPFAHVALPGGRSGTVSTRARSGAATRGGVGSEARASG